MQIENLCGPCKKQRGVQNQTLGQRLCELFSSRRRGPLRIVLPARSQDRYSDAELRVFNRVPPRTPRKARQFVQAVRLQEVHRNYELIATDYRTTTQADLISLTL